METSNTHAAKQRNLIPPPGMFFLCQYSVEVGERLSEMNLKAAPSSLSQCFALFLCTSSQFNHQGTHRRLVAE